MFGKPVNPFCTCYASIALELRTFVVTDTHLDNILEESNRIVCSSHICRSKANQINNLLNHLVYDVHIQ